MTKVFVGADHRGFGMKELILGECSPGFVSGQSPSAIVDLSAEGFSFEDAGAFSEDPEDDFNGPARAVAKKVLDNPGTRGVLICGTGVGMSIQANRFPGVRAVLARSKKDARLAREHNDANILCLGGDETDYDDAAEIIQVFLKTEFLGNERYRRRNSELDVGFNIDKEDE
ncbi:MAG: RpiB/LacA/LacB family sugar-phosphate isomerase [Candidatus Saccharibacteria bacterium]|nr:RpiB/LacA/LacB family sugar-phosphate isomerase [Candidatus Saccharibacteria bacterium]